MEQIITKPLKRLFSNSKEYAKKQFFDICNTHAVEYSTNGKEDTIIMTEIKSIMRTPPNTRDEHNRHITKYNVLFDENIKISSPEMPRKCMLNDCDSTFIDNTNSANINNNTIEHLTVTLTDSPLKETVTLLNLTQTESDKPAPENSEIHSSDKLKQSEVNNKSTQHIKVKIIVPKSNIDKDSSRIEDTKQAVTNIGDPESLQKCVQNTENECIFEENKSCPLSPVLVKSKVIHQFPVVDELIDFHERQMLHLTGRLASGKIPLMGTSALLSRAPNSQSTLDDSEIVSALVRDRFIVNMYESRTCRRNRNKPSRFGRIYRSLERTVGTDFSSNVINDKKQNLNRTVPEIINVKQSSPIKLADQLVSLNLNTQCVHNKRSNEQSLDMTKENEQINSYTLPQEKENINVRKSDKTQNETAFEQDSTKIVNSEENELCDNEVITDEQSECTENSDQIMSDDDIETVLNADFTNSTTSLDTIAENRPAPDETKEIIKDVQIGDKVRETLEESNGTDASYNMEEFLQKALGDELCNDTSLDATTELKEKVKTAPQKYVLAEDSICTSDASDLLSKINTFQSNFYRSLTRKIQHMSNTFRAPPSSKRETRIDDELDSIFPNNEQVTELVRQAAVQYEAMKQISKALTVCRNTKEFSDSTEQIEGERLLLVAANKRQAILDEIRRLDYAVEESNPTTETGTVTISDVTLPLKTEITEQHISKRDQKQWYVCTFSCGARVFATQPTLAKMDRSIKFSEEITFSDLPSDFSISIEIYSLLQRRSSRNFSHESKFHINKSSRRTHCPTPKKFLHREKMVQKIPTRYDTGIRTSSFKFCGGLKLGVSDLSKASPWMLRKVPMCSPIEGSLTLHLQSRVQIPIRYSGFMTIGLEIGGCVSWNRRWCVIDGHTFRYWNYPCDEDAFNPLHEIDLKKCMNAQIDLVDRTLCAKPRTLLLETTPETERPTKSSVDVHNIRRYLLSADNSADLKVWKTHLNTVVIALRTWNVGYVF